MGFKSAHTFGFGAPALPGSTSTVTNVLVNHGGAITWEPAVRWVDLCRVDFSLLPDQEFVADGPVGIGGTVWNVKNFANQVAGSYFGIKNGHGLRLGAASDVGYATMVNNSRTTPRVRLRLASYNLTGNTPLRCLYELAYVRSNSDGYRTLCSIMFEETTGDYYSNTVYASGGKASTGGDELLYTLHNWYRGRVFNGVMDSTDGAQAPLGNHNQVGLWLPQGIPAVKGVGYLTAPPSVDAWTNLDLAVSANWDSSTTVIPSTMTYDLCLVENWSCVLASGTEGAHVARYPVIKRFVLQARKGLGV